MHKAFLLPVIEFPLAEEVPTASEESSRCQKKRDATAKRIALLSLVRNFDLQENLFQSTSLSLSIHNKKWINKIPPLPKYQSWTQKNSSNGNLEYNNIFNMSIMPCGSKYKTAQELWAAILKTFGGNKATKKTKKNLLKQQYGNFKAEGSKTLEQMFNRLRVIVGQLQFMDVDVEHDDLNQKFLTSLAPEWLMHTIVWRNRSDLDTMSLDDLYNHLKVYESKVQMKSVPNSHNMAFISSAKHSRGNEDVNTASVSTASTNVPTASANIRVASISQDTTCAYIASQSSGSQIKFKDINQIDEDDMEEMDIKWSMAILSMRADKFWKKIGKKISIQGSDVAGFDKLKVKCFNCHKMGHFARECRAPRSQDRGRRDNYRQGSKVKEQAPKALMAIDGVFDNSLYSKDCKKNNDSLNSKITDLTDKLFDAKNMIYHYKLGLTQVESRLVEHKDREIKYCEKVRDLEFRTESNNEYIEILKKELETLKKEKEGVDGKLAGFLTASKDLDNLIESQRSDKNKEGLRYNVVPTPPAQIYSSPKKDLSWTGLPEFADDTITNYSRPSPTMESTSGDDQNKNPSVFETDASTSTITPKPCIKFVKPNDNPSKSNISYLSDYEPFDGGYVSFGQGGCKITGKGTIKTGKLKFENVYFMKDLKYNLFSVSQICDNKNSVLFIDSKCIVLGRDFKLLNNANILLRTPRQHNMYSIDLNNIIPHKDLTCLVAKASADECMLWHRRLGHLNFITMNKLVRYNLVRGLPTKCFENDHTCTACLKGKQHKASLTDDFSRFTWTFFLKSKDETSGILKKFITEIENLKDLKVKIIRTLIEAARTMLADAKLPVTFWAEAVNTACYVQNRVLVNKSHNKTSYELFNGRSPAIGFHKLFGCHVMILNTLDNLGKFKKKGDEGYFIGYSMSSKAFRVFYKRTRRVEENLHVEFLENKVIEKGAGPNWLFDIDSLIKSMNYVPVDADHCSTEVPKSSGNINPTASTSNPSADQMETLTVESPTPTVSSPVPTACFTDSQEPSNESNGVEADVSNMETTITTSPTPTLRIHKDHPKSQIIGPVDTLIQTRNKSKEVLKNKKDERRIVIRNKARLVAQGHTQEKRIDYDEVFAPVARIKAIRLFLAYASFMGFIVYQMDVKSDFLYGILDEEVYVMQPSGFQDLEFPTRVYKVEKAMYGLHQAPRAWYVKRIFRYLKGHPKLGLWYPKESHFNLVSYSDSDYGSSTQDRKSTTRGGQFLGRRLISWKCKKQTIMATSTTEAKYVAAASCCGQVLWIQNQLLNYGYNFMNYIDNNSAICIVKNPVYHSKTKHIEIKHHFIRDCFEKKLINVDHIHTDGNVADLLTKPCDTGRF
uniref:CCHC-type domain-containing protein n=1 Tax=Tanacetum cinerariifolium TaxID=118510 RepID=A0A6L2NNJ8_TANCI|nr:hypothetical protein [Tanacetum cinerariifolium]